MWIRLDARYVPPRYLSNSTNLCAENRDPESLACGACRAGYRRDTKANSGPCVLCTDGDTVSALCYGFWLWVLFICICIQLNALLHQREKDQMIKRNTEGTTSSPQEQVPRPREDPSFSTFKRTAPGPRKVPREGQHTAYNDPLAANTQSGGGGGGKKGWGKKGTSEASSSAEVVHRAMLTEGGR